MAPAARAAPPAVTEEALRARWACVSCIFTWRQSAPGALSVHLRPRATAHPTQVEATGLAATVLASALRMLRARASNGRIVASLVTLGLGRLLLLLPAAASPWMLGLVIATTATGRATCTRAPLSRMRTALHLAPGVSTVSALVP